MEQRQQFIASIQTAMTSLAASGIEVLALSETDRHIDKAGEYPFMGIWRFTDALAREALLAGIKASGWYDYFDHLNAVGNTGILILICRRWPTGPHSMKRKADFAY